MKFSLQLGSFNLSLGKSWSALSDFLRGGSGAGTLGGAQLTNALEQSVWVYSCITAISEQIAHIPFVFSQGERDGEKIIKDGEIVQLFKKPNDHLDRYLFWDLLVQWLCLRGKVYLVATDKAGTIVDLSIAGGRLKPIRALHLLNPDRVRPDLQAGVLTGYKYSAGFHDPIPTQHFLPGELIALRTANPYDVYDGLPPLGVALLAAQTDYASAQFMKGLMMNNADTGVIVTTDQQLSSEQQIALQKALQERKRKAGTADRPLFLFGGAKVEKPTLSAVDMQFLENRKFNRQEICAVFRVPQEVLGFVEDANRAVANSVRLSFIDNRIAPFCERLEAAMEPIVAAFGEGLIGWFNLDQLGIRQQARRERFTGAKIGFDLGYSRNELNKAFDLGMPNDPSGEKRYLPFSLQPVESDGSFPEEPEPAPVPTEVDAAKGVLAVLRGIGRSPTEIHQCGPASSAYAHAIQGSVKRKRKTLRNFFIEQQARVLDRITELDKAFAPPVNSEILSKGIDDIFEMLAENEKLLKKMTPLLKGDLLFGGSQVWQELGLNPADFAVPPTKAIEFLEKRTNEIKGINKTTFEKLKGSLAEGLKEGDTQAELVARVKDVYANATDARAERIAITETNIATNSGRFEGMTEAGVERKGWQASNLEGVRQEHLQAEADYQDEGVPIDEPFVVGGEELIHPGDPSGSPGNTINCRCFTFAVLPEKSAKACCPAKFLTFEEFVLSKASA